MIHPEHLRKVIREALYAMHEEPLRFGSLAAVELLMLIAAQESRLGQYLWQHRQGMPAGPAIGIFQMEPGRWRDTVDRWPDSLRDAVVRSTGCSRPDMQPLRAAWNLRYATCMARAALWLVHGKLPEQGDIDGMDAYYQRAWCRGCAAKPGDAARAYRRLVLGKREP